MSPKKAVKVPVFTAKRLVRKLRELVKKSGQDDLPLFVGSDLTPEPLYVEAAHLAPSKRQCSLSALRKDQLGAFMHPLPDPNCSREPFFDIPRRRRAK